MGGRIAHAREDSLTTCREVGHLDHRARVAFVPEVHESSSRAVALLADVREGRGLGVPFFGRAAPSNTFPALLARGRKLPLVAARVLRQSAGRYTVHCELVEVLHTDDREADILATTANIQAQFETWVRETPGQWMWGHRRWG
jgi:KDO2-lipid IV(A) lauroyltransferase